MHEGEDQRGDDGLLQPVLQEPNLRLLCHEGELNDLLGDLALHRLDVVLSDRYTVGSYFDERMRELRGEA